MSSAARSEPLAGPGHDAGPIGSPVPLAAATAPITRVGPLALGLLGLQHVLVMYAGAVAVPLIVGRALKLPPDQVAILISADLFACGLATLVQTSGLGPSASACR